MLVNQTAHNELPPRRLSSSAAITPGCFWRVLVVHQQAYFAF